jgi:cation diffusion facilitator CzcD-associated flavoprotein CzcO
LLRRNSRTKEFATMGDAEKDAALLTEKFDVIVVGAGFGGLYALQKLRQLSFETVVLEGAPAIGGTWWHNRYPGARCDIESMDYSFSFDDGLQQEWHWAERYAPQRDILDYINHVADRFDLRKDIRLNTGVVAARFDELSSRWTVVTSTGEILTAQFLIMATGVLSAAQLPQWPGLEEFQGSWYHTADWPHERVDFTGKRVGVIGTGSSGTQLIPLVAQQAADLTVFQRTANFTMPAQNRPLTAEQEVEWKANYAERRASARASANGHNQLSNSARGADATPEELEAEFQRRWDLGGLYMLRAFSDIMTDVEVNKAAANWVNRKIDSIVRNPDTAELLKPKDLFLGAKRLASGSGYYETFNRDNVHLIDVKSDPIARITRAGLATESREFELDVIIFATGFDAFTGSILKIDIQGRAGLPLREAWSAGPRSYLGLAVAGFPNLFIVAGPGSPSVASNMVGSIEHHIEWIADALVETRARGLHTIETTVEAQDEWVEHVNSFAQNTIHQYSTNTWFYGGNTAGKPTAFMAYLGGVSTYLETLKRVAEGDYRGFMLGADVAVLTQTGPE